MRLVAASLLLSLAACASHGEDWDAPPPVSTSPGSGSHDLQPPNSLPPGAAVNAPLVTPDSDLLTVKTPY